MAQEMKYWYSGFPFRAGDGSPVGPMVYWYDGLPASDDAGEQSVDLSAPVKSSQSLADDILTIGLTTSVVRSSETLAGDIITFLITLGIPAKSSQTFGTVTIINFGAPDCPTADVDPLDPWARLSHPDPVFLLTPVEPAASLEVC